MELDTMVGENGGTFIGWAASAHALRSHFKNAPILIYMDEATSALIHESERAIQVA